MTYVVDASIAVEYLLQSTIGRHASGLLSAARLIAPELLDVEVLAVVRREVLGGRLDQARATEVIEDLGAWDLERIRHRELLAAAWSLRHNVTGYDAFYLAAAQLRKATVLTSDGPLSRIPIRGFTIQNLTVR